MSGSVLHISFFIFNLKRVLPLNFEFFPYYKQVKSFLTIHDARFAHGVIWNFVSLVVMALAGLALGLVVAFFYDPYTLGIFNEVYTVYFLASQLGAMGIHQSVLRHVAAVAGEATGQGQVFWSGMLMVTATSALVTLVVVLARPAGVWWFGEAEISTALLAVCPGLFFFPLNKVMLALENGLRHMRTFALFNSLRFILLLAALLGLTWARVPGMYLPGAFSIAEALLFLSLVLAVKRDLGKTPFAALGKSAWQHMVFGIKSMPGGFLLVVNTRMDVLLLGLFLPAAQVGVYSIAAIFAEGFLQFVMIFRSNFDPLLARLSAAGDWLKLKELMKEGMVKVRLLSSLVALLGVLGFAAILQLMGERGEAYQPAVWVFLIIVAATALLSGQLGFTGILQQCGFPGYSTLVVLASVLSNAVINLALIPVWGIYGAAVGTAIAQGVLAFGFIGVARHLMPGIR